MLLRFPLDLFEDAQSETGRCLLQTCLFDQIYLNAAVHIFNLPLT